MDIERVLVSPFLRAEQTLDVVGECMNLPTSVDVLLNSRRVVMSALSVPTCRRCAMKVSLLHWSFPTCHWLAIWYLNCAGETPPMFTTSAIANVTLDETGKGVFNWQMSPCNLRMAKAI